MAKIKVMQFITGLNPGGAENMMIKTINALDSKKYDLIVCSLVGGSLEEELRKKYRVIVLGASSIFSFFSAIKKLRQILKEEKVRILHSYLYHANIVSRFAAINLPVKVISSIRIKEVGKWSHAVVDRFTSSLVDKYTTVSKSVSDFIEKTEHIPSSKILTIPNGLDFSKFPKNVDVVKKKKEFDLKKSEKVIVSVANLRNSKDYPTLFRALKIVNEKVPAVLLVVGKGEKEEEFKQCAKDAGVDKFVNFLGFRNDAFELISIADVCVLSTFYEGQSNSLLEYMALKKPIVATDIEENREVITSGVEGLLIEEKSPAKFAGAILELLNNEQKGQKLMNAAYARVKKEHDIIRVAKETEKLYEELCAE